MVSQTGYKIILERYDKNRESLLPILQDFNNQYHFLSQQSMKSIASYLHISPAEVFAVASFYSFVDTKKRGDHIIRVCKTISCDLKGKKEILSALEKRLRIKMGETTGDGKFTLESTNCIGWCHKSPAMIIDDKVYTELTASKIDQIIDSYSETGENYG